MAQCLRKNGGVRHETAVRRLRAVATRCQRAGDLWDEPFLVAAYAFGAVLDSRADLPVVQMAFVLTLPAEELTWCARPQSCVGLPQLLEIDNAPVQWYLRPSVWPVANHAIRRPLRVWSLDGGPDVAALDSLARGEADGLRLPEPSPADVWEQLAAELAAMPATNPRAEVALPRSAQGDQRGATGPRRPDAGSGGRSPVTGSGESANRPGLTPAALPWLA